MIEPNPCPRCGSKMKMLEDHGNMRSWPEVYLRCSNEHGKCIWNMSLGYNDLAGQRADDVKEQLIREWNEGTAVKKCLPGGDKLGYKPEMRVKLSDKKGKASLEHLAPRNDYDSFWEMKEHFEELKEHVEESKDPYEALTVMVIETIINTFEEDFLAALKTEKNKSEDQLFREFFPQFTEGRK